MTLVIVGLVLIVFSLFLRVNYLSKKMDRIDDKTCALVQRYNQAVIELKVITEELKNRKLK